MIIDPEIYKAPAQNTGRMTDYSDDDTYAMRLLKYLNNNKLIVKFLATNNALETNGQSLYNYVYVSIGLTLKGYKQRLSYPLLFRCRGFIAPWMWYHTVSETPPTEIKFNQQYIQFTPAMAGRSTLGHLQLRKYIEENGVLGVVSETGIKRTLVDNLLRKRKRKTGLITFHSLPSLDVTKALSSIVNPQLWFIFPEETGENEFKELKEMLNDFH